MVKDNPNKVNQSIDSESWFDEMVANLRYDQALYENDILEKDKKDVYDTMMSGNHEQLSDLGRQYSSTYFISKIVEAYFKELVKAESKPNKIALELSHSQILVWAEILEDDEIMENALILAEAKINAYFSKYGFNISSTIVEDSDCLKIPDHYKSVPIVKN